MNGLGPRTSDVSGFPMESSVLRLLDANANRAREALRVVEDYARFALDDGELSGQLKQVRHDLAEATRGFVCEAILHRDTPGDVGTVNTTESEGRREDLADVVTAAGKRLGEALRAIEEYLKTESHVAAARVEALRYRFYELEHRLAFTLRPAGRFEHVRLYVLITESLCRRPWLEAAEAAILGGADCLQLREKTLDGGELLRRARQMTELCRRHGVLSVINDCPDIALLSGADGVHVGQDDLPAREVRKLLGRGKIVGVSTHRIEQAKQAVLDGADYLGVGPFFRSETKPRDFVAGPTYARQVVESVRIPAVAIAGITAGNVDEVLATGIRAVAVTSAVLCAADVRAAATGLKAKLNRSGAAPPAFPPASGAGPVAQTFLSVSGGHSCPPEPEGEVQVSRRSLPHWRLKGSTYYLTFRILRGASELAPVERQIVLSHLKGGDGLYYDLVAVVVMPDHVHALLRPREGIDLPRITKGVKGVSARLVNEARGTRGSLWQDESWDRIVRDQDELDEKLQYMLDNPVRKGLVADGWDYDGWYVNQEAV